MAIKLDDGQFALDCWLSEKNEDEPESLFSDNISELEFEAERLIAAGRFGYLELSRWNPVKEDWDLIRFYEPE